MTLEHLILLRHGETDWNRAQRLQGHRDIALNDAGRHQAMDAAPSIVALRPEVIVASDLSRARETADSVAAVMDLPVGVDARMRETSMGMWEGLTRDEVIADWPQEWTTRRTTSATVPPGGESRWQVASGRRRSSTSSMPAGVPSAAGLARRPHRRT